MKDDLFPVLDSKVEIERPQIAKWIAQVVSCHNPPGLVVCHNNLVTRL